MNNGVDASKYPLMRGLRAYSVIGEASKLPIQTDADLADAVSGVLLILHGSDLGETGPIDKELERIQSEVRVVRQISESVLYAHL